MKSKIQFRNNAENGYTLRYGKNKMVKAGKYENNVKTGEWTSLYKFKIDNPNVLL